MTYHNNSSVGSTYENIATGLLSDDIVSITVRGTVASNIVERTIIRRIGSIANDTRIVLGLTGFNNAVLVKFNSPNLQMKVPNDTVTDVSTQVVELSSGDNSITLSDEDILDLAQGTRSSADRGKYLGTSTTDEDSLALISPPDVPDLPDAPANQSAAKKYNLNVPASSGDATWTEDTGGGGGGVSLSDDAVLDLAKTTRTVSDRGKALGASETDEDQLQLLTIPNSLRGIKIATLALPTAATTGEYTGLTITMESNLPSGFSAYSDKGIYVPSLPPSQRVLGLWGVAVEDTTERAATLMLWGPGSIKVEGSGFDYSFSSLHFDDNENIDLKYEHNTNALIGNTIVIYGDGSPMPDNAKVVIYLASI